MDPRIHESIAEGLRPVPVTRHDDHTLRIPVLVVPDMRANELQRPPLFLKAIKLSEEKL